MLPGHPHHRYKLHNETIERLLYQKGGKVSRGPEDIPFIAKQTRIVLKNCGKFDAESLNEYIASGGFQALEKAMFEMDQPGVQPESISYLPGSRRHHVRGYRIYQPDQ